MGVGVGEQDSLGGRYCEFGEPEGVGQCLGVGVEDGEGVVGGSANRAEAQLVALRDGQLHGFLVFGHCITYQYYCLNLPAKCTQ